jgi:hypothetical protein
MRDHDRHWLRPRGSPGRGQHRDPRAEVLEHPERGQRCARDRTQSVRRVREAIFRRPASPTSPIARPRGVPPSERRPAEHACREHGCSTTVTTAPCAWEPPRRMYALFASSEDACRGGAERDAHFDSP